MVGSPLPSCYSDDRHPQLDGVNASHTFHSSVCTAWGVIQAWRSQEGRGEETQQATSRKGKEAGDEGGGEIRQGVFQPKRRYIYAFLLDFSAHSHCGLQMVWIVCALRDAKALICHQISGVKIIWTEATKNSKRATLFVCMRPASAD